MGKIYFRADGSSSMGLGHVYRSCALAEMLQPHFDCSFIIRAPVAGLKVEIEKHCREVIELDSDLSLPEDAARVAEMITSGDILVLDGYQFDADYQEAIRKGSAGKLVCIDDIHATHFFADVVINHIGGIKPEDYDAESNTQFFLGLKYGLVRKEFLQQQPVASEGREQNLLVCLGGSDPVNDTLQIIRKIDAGNFQNIHILIGAGYRFRDSLEAEAAKSAVDIEIHQNLGAAEVAALMSQCGNAVLSPSSISYEYMSLGGVVFLCQIADNQKRVREFFLEKGLALDFEAFGPVPEVARQEMTERQALFFDRKSPDRLATIFRNLTFLNNTTIRMVGKDDVKITHTWANDPETRRMSYNTADIPFDSHENWFLKKIAEPDIRYYIFEDNAAPFAQIRFEKKADGYMLSYAIDHEYRGRGLGSFVLAEGLKQLKKDVAAQTAVYGYVKTENRASCSSFEKLDFSRTRTEQYPDSFRYTIPL